MNMESIFFTPIKSEFDVKKIRSRLLAMVDAVADPLGGDEVMLCGNADGVERYRDKRIERPDRFPYCTIVTVTPSEIHVFQAYSNEAQLESSRSFVSWILETFPCRIDDQYGSDWTSKVETDGIRVLY
jgi:hypothetical protein